MNVVKKTTQPCRLRNLPCKNPLGLLAAALLGSATMASAAWLREEGAIAWQTDEGVLWRFSYDNKEGKPFFHPLSADGHNELTTAKPADHVWHYGLWFSWKYINGANYWEQSRASGASEGSTRWKPPVIQTSAEGAAKIEMSLEYVHPSGRVDLEEERQLSVSAVGEDGAYTIDWTSRFIAGPEGAKLDRTPMPGEPNGQVNGGYAGLSLRLAQAPMEMTLVSEDGPVSEFQSSRARPDALVLAANFKLNEQSVGSVAVLSDPANLPGSSPWYAISSEQMRFFCSAILAPKPLELAPGQKLALRYRIVVRPEAWTPTQLRDALAGWK